MNFTNTYILENKIARLEPLQESDFDRLLHFSLNEQTLWKYSLTPANGEENLKKYIDFAIQSRIEEKSYPFLVIDKRNNKVAGSTRFYDYQKVHNTFQLGYTWYGKDFQGTGLNKNCKYLLLEFAFDQIGLNRVEFRADNNNTRSINAMKSIGCIPEGVLRSNCQGHSGRRDSIILSILKHEWEGGIKERLAQKITTMM